MPHAVINTLLFALAFVLLVAGSLQLVYLKKSHVNFLLFGMYLSISYALFYFWLSGSGILPHFLVSTDMSLVFLIGPSYYFYFSMLAGVNRASIRAVLIGPLSFGVVLGIIICCNLLIGPEGAGQAEGYVHHFTYTGFRKLANRISDYVLAGWALALLGRLVWAGIPVKRKSRNALVSFMMALVFFTGALFMLGTQFYESTVLVVLSIGCFAATAVVFLFYSYRYLNETQVNPGKSKPPAPVFDEEKVGKLELLFIEEQLYRDPELTLETVARQLGMTENQLSMLVNSSFKMNFRSYLNSYRLDAARKLLLAEPDMKILEVAFRVGFNSKSSFNTLFKNSFAETPMEYRSRNL